MSRSAPPAWHVECRDLRRRGWSPEQLASHFGKALATVRWLLDEHGERGAQCERVKERRAAQRTETRRAAARPATMRLVPLAAHNAALHADLVMRAARAFAAGEIDRATLMARIRGGAA